MTETAQLQVDVLQRYSEWQFGVGQGGQLGVLNTWKESSGLSYNLQNTKISRYLGWGKQTAGVNLVYSADAGAATAQKMSRWFFARSGGGTSPVRYGEMLAMGYGTSPSFYRYQDTHLGINLANAGAPAYEWALIGSPGTEGQAVAAGAPVAIWNTHGTFLIHFDRTAGVDLGWPDSKTWGEQIGQVAWEKAKWAVESYVKSYIGG